MRPGHSSPFAGFVPRNRVLRHILFWTGVYVVNVTILGLGYGYVDLFLKIELLEMPAQVAFACAVMYWIIPRHLRRNKTMETLGLTFLVLLLCGIISHLLFLPFDGYSDKGIPPWDIPKILVRTLYVLLKGGMAIAIKLAMMWYENEKRMAAMEKSSLESELKALKDQVNPHFMFNTLNNLYGLVEKNPVHAQESILRLSGILHFMLHKSNHPTIPLHMEIKCINDYIGLEKLRYTDPLPVSFNVQEEVKELSIVPLMIFPFVENSFKHGASELIRDARINIDLSAYRDDLIFKIENNKGPAHQGSNGGGIGLKNVKRRLELVYGQEHTLQIIDGTDSFLVILKIALRRLEKKTFPAYESDVSYR